MRGRLWSLVYRSNLVERDGRGEQGMLETGVTRSTMVAMEKELKRDGPRLFGGVSSECSAFA